MTVLAFDYGTRKIGVAIGNTVSCTARELTSIAPPESDNWQAMDALFSEWRPDTAIVGLPLTEDGGEQAITAAARAFAKNIAERFACDIELVDERFSSHAARTQLRNDRSSGARPRRLKRGDVDAAAAALLLRDWLGAPQ